LLRPDYVGGTTDPNLWKKPLRAAFSHCGPRIAITASLVERSEKTGAEMKPHNFDAIPLDELWELHETVIATLESKLKIEKRELEKQLEGLSRRLGESADNISRRRRYPKVMPKFRNPARPSETWAGRGKQPRWVSELLASGASLNDCRI
jgi:DNA-binding protein H-NS